MGAQDTGLTVNVVGGVIHFPECAALLLSPVREPLPYPRTRQEVEDLSGRFWELHTKGYGHGDCRVPNVIRHEGKLLWTDLAEVIRATTTLKRFDAAMLTRSILRVSLISELDPRLMDLIESYAETTMEENRDRLTKAVMQALGVSS